MKSQSRFPIFSLVALLGAAPSLALPESLTYSAHVDSGDAPFDGAASMVFTLFDARDGSSALWTESAASVVVVSGELAHDLGSVTPLGPDLLDRDELYLEVAFNGTTLSPRVAFAAVPFALRARDAESAELCSLADDAEHAVNADHAAQADQATTATSATSATTAQNATQLGGRAAADYQFGVAASGGLALSGTSFSVASNGITRDHLRNGEVVLGKLGAGAVDASALASGAVTGAKIASGTISGDKIASGSISASHLSGGRVALAVRPVGCGGGLQTQNLSVTSGSRGGGCTGGVRHPTTGLWTCSSSMPCHCAQCDTLPCGANSSGIGPASLQYANCDGSCSSRTSSLICNASDFADTSVGYAVFE